MTSRFRSLSIMLVSAWCLSGQAVAATPEIRTASSQTGSSWVVQATEQECHLARQFRSEGGLFWLDIVKGGGPEQLDLVLAGEGVPKVTPGLYFWLGLTSQGQSRRFSAVSDSLPRQKGRLLLVKDVPSRMLSDLATDLTLTLSSRNSPFLELHVAEAKEAFGKLQDCYANLLKTWNVDASHLALPILAPGRNEILDYGNQGSITPQRSDLPKLPDDSDAWIRSIDYPTRALREEVSGAVVVALSVKPSGQVINCDVVVSSKFAPLDEQTCTLMLARANYQPWTASSPDELPKRAVERVRWIIPSP